MVRVASIFKTKQRSPQTAVRRHVWYGRILWGIQSIIITAINRNHVEHILYDRVLRVHRIDQSSLVDHFPLVLFLLYHSVEYFRRIIPPIRLRYSRPRFLSLGSYCHRPPPPRSLDQYPVVAVAVAEKNDKNDGSIFSVGCGTPQEYWVGWLTG